MNRRGRTSLFLACGLSVLSVILSLFTPFPLQAQEKKNIRFVLVGVAWNSILPLRIALAKGYFREQGLTVEPIFIRGGPTAMAALISGDADFGSVGGAQAVIRARV